MKELLLQVVKFSLKLTVFYFFFVIFGLALYYTVLKPELRQLSEQQTFNVDAVAKSNFTPDTAVVSSGAIFEGTDVKALKKQADNNLTAAITELEAMGIDKEMITSNYQIDPKYDKDYVNIVGHKATTTLSVKTKDFTQIDGILEIVIANDFNRVDGVYFTFEDPVAIRESLREEAIATAKAKAEKIASESGLNLGRLINVVEGSYYPYYDQYRVNTYMESASSVEDVPSDSQSFNPGESELSMQVTLIYEVN